MQKLLSKLAAGYGRLVRFSDTRFFEYFLVILLFVGGFGVRLWKINNPIADWHSWRQVDTASVSRIYVEEGIDILRPRYYDISSVQTGIFNEGGLRYVEFPIFNVIHALAFKYVPLLSFEAWGRMISILSSMLSFVFIYLLGKKVYGKWVGLTAGFLFLFIPYNIYFSRVILPEPMAVMFVTGSLYFFVDFIEGGKAWKLYFSGILLALAASLKPFVYFYGLPMLYLAVKKWGWVGAFSNKKILVFANLAFDPFFIWRIWVNLFPEGIPHFSWAFNGDGIRFRPAFWRWIFGERLGRLILGIWGILPFSLGILKLEKAKALAHLMALGMFMYVVVVATANVRHDYYQALTIPALVMLTAIGLVWLWNFHRPYWVGRALAVFSVVMMLGMGAYQAKEFYNINHPEIVEVGNIVDARIPKDAQIIAPYNGDTAFLYHTRRFGWPIVEEDFAAIIEKGADYYVSLTLIDADTKMLEKKYKTIEKTDKYIIIDLHQKL